MPYWSVVLKAPQDQRSKIKLEYLPGMIFFKSDGDVKGIAVFSSQDAAQGFREQISAMTTLEVLCTPLKTAEDVNAWSAMLMAYLGPKKVKELPIYLDPPDAYCKGVNVPREHKSLRTFISRCMPDLDPMAGDVVAFKPMAGSQVVVCRDKATKKYAALVHIGGAPDQFESGAAMVHEYLDSVGTTDERLWRRTQPVGSVFTAMEDAQRVAITPIADA